MIWWGIVGIIVDNIVDGARFDNVDNGDNVFCRAVFCRLGVIIVLDLG